MKASESNSEVTRMDHHFKTCVLEFNNTRSSYPDSSTVLDLFERQVARIPSAEAVRHIDAVQTYEQLDESSSALAGRLASLGVRKGAFVLLLLEHSVELVDAIIATIKAGAAYVPVDPSTPRDRIKFVISDLREASPDVMPTVITQSKFANLFDENSVTLILTDVTCESAKSLTATRSERPGPADIAYVIYTSGSTGTPKGVMVEHRNLVNYIWWANQVYCQGESLTWPLFSSIAFDLTVTSIFTPLISGGSIIIYRDQSKTNRSAVLMAVQDNRSDIVKLTPSHLAMVRALDLSGSRIRRFIVGGEEFKISLAKDIERAFSKPVQQFNEYGPTEATVGCMVHCYDSQSDTGASVPIGVPAANTAIYILDEQCYPVSPGVTGEIYIAGEGLARGYLNRPELTAERFRIINDPRTPNASPPKLKQVYRTGDMARWNVGGAIEFLGRVDHQVKIGGMRIELGEIEAQILRFDGVTECIVVVHRVAVSSAGCDAETDHQRNEGDRLVGYYVASADVLAEDLRDHLVRVLPPHMVPTYLTRLPSLPLTSNGKIDRSGLPGPASVNLGPVSQSVDRGDASHSEIAQIMKDLFKVDSVGMSDDFFALGGDSMMAIRLIQRIKSQHGVDLPLQLIFQTPTLDALEEALKREQSLMQGRTSTSALHGSKPIARLARVSLSSRGQ